MGQYFAHSNDSNCVGILVLFALQLGSSIPAVGLGGGGGWCVNAFSDLT